MNMYISIHIYIYQPLSANFAGTQRVLWEHVSKTSTSRPQMIAQDPTSSSTRMTVILNGLPWFALTERQKMWDCGEIGLELYYIVYIVYIHYIENVDSHFCSNSRWFGTQREFTTSPNNCIVTGSSCSFVMIPHHSPSIPNILNRDDRSNKINNRTKQQQSLTHSKWSLFCISPKDLYNFHYHPIYISQYCWECASEDWSVHHHQDAGVPRHPRFPFLFGTIFSPAIPGAKWPFPETRATAALTCPVHGKWSDRSLPLWCVNGPVINRLSGDGFLPIYSTISDGCWVYHITFYASVSRLGDNLIQKTTVFPIKHRGFL